MVLVLVQWCTQVQRYSPRPRATRWLWVHCNGGRQRRLGPKTWTGCPHPPHSPRLSAVTSQTTVETEGRCSRTGIDRVCGAPTVTPAWCSCGGSNPWLGSGCSGLSSNPAPCLLPVSQNLCSLPPTPPSTPSLCVAVADSSAQSRIDRWWLF